MISVCIATHNGEKYIKEQLDSILCQLSTDDEVIISDDGSTDKTFEIIEGLNDSRIKVHHYTQPSKSTHSHIYTSRNFENALKYAKGEYIFLSDQDDVWMPNKVEYCLEKLRNHDIIVHNLTYINEKGENLNKNVHKKQLKAQNMLILGTTHLGCSIAFQKRWLSILLPFPKNLLLHDFWISYIIEFVGNPYYEDKSLMWYRYREDSVSHKVNNTLLFKIKYRIVLIFQIFTRIIKMKTKVSLW